MCTPVTEWCDAKIVVDFSQKFKWHTTNGKINIVKSQQPATTTYRKHAPNTPSTIYCCCQTKTRTFFLMSYGDKTDNGYEVCRFSSRYCHTQKLMATKNRLSITNYMAKHTIHLLEILIIVIYFTRKESHMPHGKQKHINSNNQTTKKDPFSPIRCINFVKCTRVDLLLCKQNNACHRLENLARFPWLDRYKAITSLCNTLEKLGAVIKMHSKSLYHSVKSLYISRKWTKSSETNQNVRANPFGKLKRSLEQRLSQALLVR